MTEQGQLGRILQKVRRLECRVARRVSTRLAGTYRSAFRGPGLEFADLVRYQPGHDVRRIDWRVTARRSVPYVRRYVEERELRVVVLLDVSRSMDVGGPGWTLRERGALLSAALALSAVAGGDRVGALFFADAVVGACPPRTSRKHALQLVRRALAASPDTETTDLRPVLRHLHRLRAHGVVLLVSDFFTRPPAWNGEVARLLRACSRKHQLLAVRLVPVVTRNFPTDILLRATDPESRAGEALDFYGGAEAEAKRRLQDHGEKTRRCVEECGAQFLELGPDQDHLTGLEALLRRVEAQRRAISAG